MIRGLPSFSSAGPGSFTGRLETDPAPTFAHVLCGMVVTVFTSDAGAGFRPVMCGGPLSLLAPLANTNTRAPPTAITTATMIHAVRSVPFFALLAACAVRPLRAWGRCFDDPRLGCLLMRLLARKGRARRRGRTHRGIRLRTLRQMVRCGAP